MNTDKKRRFVKSIASLLVLFLLSACSISRHHEFSGQMQRLLAEDQVIAAANRLFLCTDQRDWNCVQNVFAPQVLFDMTSMAGGDPVTLTPEQITRSWEQGLRSLAAIHHQTGNFKVSIADNGADLFCYGIAYHYLPNPTGNNTRIFVGSYTMHLMRSDDGWRIDRFKFNLKFIEGNKDLEGSAQQGS